MSSPYPDTFIYTGRAFKRIKDMKGVLTYGQIISLFYNMFHFILACFVNYAKKKKNNRNPSCSCKNILNAQSSMSDEQLPQPHSVSFRTGTSNPQAACSLAQLTGQPPRAIMAAPPHLSGSRHTPGAQQQPTVSARLALCWLTSGHGEGSAVQGWLRWEQITVCILIRRLNMVLGTVKNMQPCFLVW